MGQSTGGDAGSGAQGASGAGGRRVERFGHRPPARSMTRYIKPTLWGLLLLYVVLFLFANRAPTEVNFLFFSANAPLIVALLVMFLLGAVVGVGALFLRDRRTSARAARKSKS